MYKFLFYVIYGTVFFSYVNVLCVAYNIILCCIRKRVHLHHRVRWRTTRPAVVKEGKKKGFAFGRGR